MNILVTGAAGYIGSILTEILLREGHSVIALDNLATGHKEAIHPASFFIKADLGDKKALDRLFEDNKIDAVMHLAAETQAAESMINPEKHFRTNVIYAINLLNVMKEHKVNKLIFSSTAAVYGTPTTMLPVKESNDVSPVNPYGESKLAFENVLHWYSVAYNINYIALRFFNVAGASENYGCDHENETLLIPNIFKVALGQQKYLQVFGSDYPTKDGSCIRDFIHVEDIARAHILALKHLKKNQTNQIYNLGNGQGYSVFEVIAIAKEIIGMDISMIIEARRPGDPLLLVANSDMAKKDLCWSPKYHGLESIIETAWKWQKIHPYGYSKKIE